MNYKIYNANTQEEAEAPLLSDSELKLLSTGDELIFHDAKYKVVRILYDLTKAIGLKKIYLEQVFDEDFS